MGDIEIQIRRSTKSTENQNTNLSTAIRSSAITQQSNGLEKKNTTDEKVTKSGNYWDYSVSYGKVN